MSSWLIIGIGTIIIYFLINQNTINDFKERKDRSNTNLHNYRMENDEEYRKYVEYVQKNDPESDIYPGIDLHTNNSHENKD